MLLIIRIYAGMKTRSVQKARDFFMKKNTVKQNRL